LKFNSQSTLKSQSSKQENFESTERLRQRQSAQMYRTNVNNGRHNSMKVLPGFLIVP